MIIGVIASQSADWRGNPHLKKYAVHVYILSNTHKTVLYTGVTNDLIRRVYEHKNHLDKQSFTSRYNVDQLVYYETTPNVEAAIEREKQIKGWSRKHKNKLIESKNPNWVDMYRSIQE